MEPHDLPSLYPGIFIGFLIGLHAGGLPQIVAGTIGGATGAAGAIALNKHFPMETDFYSFVLFVVLTTATAKFFVMALQSARRFFQKRI